MLQVITIAEERFAAYRRQPDFIQRYIFPAGMLPTVGASWRHAEQAGLQLVAHEEFGASYALTLAEWRKRFLLAKCENLVSYSASLCPGSLRSRSSRAPAARRAALRQ